MRSLNKIIFINSADKSLKYSEIDLDGNVHFIGTQGVGKSTLLRAILFFYNADTQKLGISRDKKNYNEYYFPYQNSYIIYEVNTEIGKYCILSFKHQGRIAFRFINSGYEKSFFIDTTGKAYETFDKIRVALGRVDITRIINNYEEYRNILYGNNKGLSNEFRKFDLIESKQFQNIPRTITNVLLNSDLKAEFIKETIIKSLNNDEIKIDLTTYSHTHLRDFEANINDIKKWTEGKIDKQAEKVIELYKLFNFLEQQKKDLAYQIGYVINYVNIQIPLINDQIIAEKIKQKTLNEELNQQEKSFESSKIYNLELIGEITGKIKEIKTKKDEYHKLNIDTILNRVSNKTSLELENKNLSEEKKLLTFQFDNIQERYEAQFRQIEIQFNEYKNNIQNEINKIEKEYNQFEKEINSQYDSIYETVYTQNKQILEKENQLVNQKIDAINKQHIKLSETKNKQFFEKEINQTKIEIVALKNTTSQLESKIQKSYNQIKSLQKEWDFEQKNHKRDTEIKLEKQSTKLESLKSKIIEIETKIENSKDSLYGWLNDNILNWQHTIGKVIDEENILFLKGLNPQKINNQNDSFYGIKIDTYEIKKNVKSINDLKNDQNYFKQQIVEIEQNIQNIQIQLTNDLDKIKKNFQPKIQEQKDIILESNYKINKSKSKVDEFSLQLIDLEDKAQKDKELELEKIEDIINKLREDKTKLEIQVKTIETNILTTIKSKKEEKEFKLKEQSKNLNYAIQQFNLQKSNEEKNINLKIETIKKNSKIKN